MSHRRLEKYRYCSTCGQKSRQFTEDEALGFGGQLMWAFAGLVFPVGIFLMLAWPSLLPRRQWTCAECMPEEY